MKKALKIIAVILAVIVVITAGLVIWQYENISAFIDGVNLDEEQINKKNEETQKVVTDYIENNNIGTLRPMTPEEEAAYNNGEITKQDATKIMTGQITLEDAKQNKIEEDKKAEQEKNEQPKNEQQNNQQTKPADKPADKPLDNKTDNKPEQDENVDYDTLINEKVAELYVIKANYYAEFGAYWAAAKAEFLARPVEEHTTENVAAVVKARMGEGLAMEDRYDAQVDQVVAELTELLKKAGRDTKLATAVKNAYVSEKKAEKARIIAKYFG